MSQQRRVRRHMCPASTIHQLGQSQIATWTNTKLLNPDVGHIDITLDQVQVTNHGRLGWNVVFIRHTQFIQRKQILYRQDLCLQKDNPCGTLTQQDKTSQSKQTQCNSRRLAGQTINEQQSLGKIANEVYSTLSVTNLQTPPIGIEDDPIPRKACFPVPNIFSVQRVNGSSPCQPPSPRNLRTSEKINRQNMERKIKVQEHEASTKGTTMSAYRMRIKEQEEIRDKSNPAASKKPSLNAILKEIPKFKNHGTTNTQRQRNPFKQTSNNSHY